MSTPDQAEPITEFRGAHRFLSNFWVEPVQGIWVQAALDSVVPAASAEHLFQALKAQSVVDRLHVLNAPTPGEAKRRGRRIDCRLDWEEVKVAFMAEVVCAKFAPGTTLAEQLLATGDVDLVEGNSWGDTTWGCVWRGTAGWVGQNLLGRILVLTRTGLREA